MNYFFHLIIYLSIYSIVALSLNIVVGYCGLLTLAHAAYFAVGGYVYALSSIKLGLSFFPSLTIAICVAAALSLALSFPAWRFKGDLFVMISLSVQSLLFSAFYNWTASGAGLGTWTNMTNGPFGIAGIPKPAIFGSRLDTVGGVAALSLVIFAAIAVLTRYLLGSPWGRLLKAQRDDDLAARGLGKNVRLLKTEALAISSGMAAAAGSIYAAYVSYIDPGMAALDASILMLCMVIVGGAGNFRGPLIGALVLLSIPEVLRFASISDAVAANLRLLVYGLLLILLVRFRPQGLAGEYRIE
jgi:branched-chain amino acid transport system permease protein